MCLQAETPLRMREAVLNGEPRVLISRGAVHRLQEEMLEVQILVKLRFGVLLREDKF